MSKVQSQRDERHRKTWATRIGRFGLAARGIVYSIIGFFLIQAARLSNSNRVRGLEGALDSLARQPYRSFITLGRGK
ncbi:MAG: DUF1206 domain-containing protein [Microcoleus sp. SIO2G3]|nr:DUF1206 domain-containing protein [Microcoleus sp. SIO2G3]